ncbi:MAG: PAS domain S-box protein, partial [Dehalococcoidia bacterium]|nr:PAS domain S-box protein [Dehalococcoidia bacterium]
MGKPAKAVKGNGTKLKRSEIKLQEVEAVYSTMVEQVRDGIYIAQDEAVKFVNGALTEIIGYSKEELESMHFLDIVMPEYGEKTAQRYKSRIEGDSLPPFFELKIRCKDGTVKDIEATGTVIQYNGKPAIMGVIRDITERKHREEELRKSQEKWQALVENTSEAVSIVDSKGSILFVNHVSSWHTVEETIGTSIYDYLTPSDQNVVRKALKSVFKSKKTERYEVSSLILDGRKVWYENSVTPIKHDGRIIAALIISLDVTKRKNMELEIKSKEEYFRSLIENSLDTITVLNEDGTLRYASPSFERILGRSLEDETEYYGLKYVFEDDMQRAADAFAGLIQNPGSI